MIRRASPADAPAVARLLRDFNTEFDSAVPPVDVLAGRFARLLRSDDVLVQLAGEPGAEIGFALVTLRPTPYYDGPLAQLEELYVRPALRGRGLGGGLMDAVEQEARECGAQEMQINVDSVDVDTRRFYERRGFVNVRDEADGPMLCYERGL